MTDNTDRLKAEIIGGVLDIVIVCPQCAASYVRTIDYRIVDITGVSCPLDCGAMFDVKVQNVFDAVYPETAERPNSSEIPNSSDTQADRSDGGGE